MLFKDEKVKQDITKAYCGGDGSVNSFSRFGKRERIEEAKEDEEDEEKSMKEDDKAAE